MIKVLLIAYLGMLNLAMGTSTSGKAACPSSSICSDCCFYQSSSECLTLQANAGFSNRDCSTVNGVTCGTCLPDATPSPTAGEVTDQDIWSGTYTVGDQCDTSSCCCLTGDAAVVQSGVSVTINAGLEGPECGGQTSTTLSFELSDASSTSADFTALGQSFTASKSGNTVSVTNNDFPACSNTAELQTTSGTLDCFHEDTRITYKGQDLSLSELKEDHKECYIPHVVKATGLKIHATCADGDHVLRLTDGHLVFTEQGLKAAEDIVQGKDILFADMKESKPCSVSRVERETKVQKYFGLNCLQSEVLAEGLKASTFEKFHVVPATWMNMVGSAFGVQLASFVGEFFVDVASSMHWV